MTAQLLHGRPVAADLQDKARARSEALRARLGRAPRLAIVGFGQDESAARYSRQIERQARSTAIEVEIRPAVPEPTPDSFGHQMHDLNRDPAVDAILVQLPLPAGWPTSAAADLIDPSKDVDGISPRNVGLLAQGRWAPAPNTALAGLAVIDHYAIEVTGRRVVIVGRSLIVGRPVGYLLLNRDATITFCHTRTVDLPAITREAEVLLVATGRPGLIQGSAVRPGAVVLDFGTNVDPEGRLVGDVEAESASAVAGALTPVPGGIGPVTTACLLTSVVELAERRAG